MADSIRKQIMDAVIDALKGISQVNGYQTNVRYVSERWIGYDEVPAKNIPAVFPVDTDEEREPLQVGIGTTDDTQATLTVVCTCIVYDRYNETMQQRTDLMRDVEKALVNNAALAALISYIEPSSITTDGGSITNYSVWDQTFLITYVYGSTAGG